MRKVALGEINMLNQQTTATQEDTQAVKASHQVVCFALGGIFWIPVLVRAVHRHAHARAISITIVLQIPPVPGPSSDFQLLQMEEN